MRGWGWEERYIKETSEGRRPLGRARKDIVKLNLKEILREVLTWINLNIKTSGRF
jgi:hypothetical protein